MTIQTAISKPDTTTFQAMPSLPAAVSRSKVSVLLGRDDISGPFSLINSGPVYIQMEAGMVLLVRAGSVSVNQIAKRKGYSLLEGERLVADHDGLMTIHSHDHARLQLDWPMRVGEMPFSVARKN